MTRPTAGTVRPFARPTSPHLLGNPYVGPRPFTEEDAGRFFGREYEAREVASLLIAERIILLYSPSGAGKTSLIQARLMVTLRRRFRVLPIIRLNRAPAPGDDLPISSPNRYVESTLRCLGLSDPGAFKPASPADFANGGGGHPVPALVDYLNARPRRDDRKSEVLIFDQFEEVFTLDPTDLDEKREFFRQVGEALGLGSEHEGKDGRGPLRWALFAIREEYLGSLEPYLSSIPNRFATKFRLSFLDQNKAQAAIQGPAALAGVTVDAGTARELFATLSRRHVLRPGRQEPDVVEGHYADPVHLQIVCQRLWDRLPVGKVRVTDADYMPRSDDPDQNVVDVVLAEHYAEAVKTAAERSGGRIKEYDIRLWFDQHLITRYGLRGQVLRDSPEARRLPDEAREALLDACLLQEEQRNEATWLEIPHDRLIRPIKLNNDVWYEKHLTPVQLNAQAWNKAGRPSALLLSGRTLSDAKEWAEVNPDGLTDLDQEFLKEGIKQRDSQRKRIVLTAVIGALLIVLAYYLVAYLNEQSMLRKTRANHLAAEAQLVGETDPDKALLLAYLAWDIDKQEKQKESPVHEVLVDTLSKAGGRTLVGHDGPITKVGLTATWIVTASQDKTARLWRRPAVGGAGQFPNQVVLSGHDKAILDFDFNETNELLATASVDKTVRVWGLEAPAPSSSMSASRGPTARKPRHVLAGSPSTLNRVIFFRYDDREWVCAGGHGPKIHFWRLPKGDPGGSRPPDYFFAHSAHEGRITALLFEPKRHLLVSGSEDGTARVWLLDRLMERMAAGEIPATGIAASRVSHRLAGHSREAVTDLELAYGAREKGGPKEEPWLVSSGNDRTMRLWALGAIARREAPLNGDDAEAQELSVPLIGHNQRIVDIDVCPESELLVSGDLDGYSYVWHLADMIAEFPEKLADHSDFSAWARQGHKGYATRLERHDNSITDINISPDGRWVATAGNDNTARLWKITGLKDSQKITKANHTLFLENRVGTLEFGSIGKVGGTGDDLLLITGCDDETAKAWKVGDLGWERENLLIDRPRNTAAEASGSGAPGRGLGSRNESFRGSRSADLAGRCKKVLLKHVSPESIKLYIKQVQIQFPGWIGEDYKLE